MKAQILYFWLCAIVKKSWPVEKVSTLVPIEKSPVYVMAATVSYFLVVQFGCEPLHCRIADFLAVTLELLSGFVTTF